MTAALERRKLISLAAGFTDNESLPLDETRQLLKQILSADNSGRPALQYGSTAGDDVLRRLTAGHLRSRDGSAKNPTAYPVERTLITNGSQQMLYIATETLCDPGDLVLVEDPTYFVYLGILQSHGVKARGIRMTENGIDLDHLEQVLERLKRNGQIRRLKLLYLVSYYQNPTGITTSFDTKSKALKLLKRYETAAGHPLYLLEDGAYRELRFRGADVPSALAVAGRNSRVIYAGTYSKPFATGTRVGFGILPEPLFTAAVRIKGNHDFGTSNLLQQLLANALKSGLYEKHLVQLQKRYEQKAEVLGKALQAHFPPAVQWMWPNGGLYYWARVPEKLATGQNSKFFKKALNNHVLYVPGELCYCDDPTRKKPNHEMRISFGAASLPNLTKGIARLGAVLTNFL